MGSRITVDEAFRRVRISRPGHLTNAYKPYEFVAAGDSVNAAGIVWAVSMDDALATMAVYFEGRNVSPGTYTLSVQSTGVMVQQPSGFAMSVNPHA